MSQETSLDFLYDQQAETAPTFQASAEERARAERLKQMLEKTVTQHEDDAYNRHWKQNYGIDRDSPWYAKLIAGLGEGGRSMGARSKDYQSPRSLARQQGLENYKLAQTTGLGQLKDLGADVRSQRTLASSNYYKSQAAEKALANIILKSQSDGVSKRLTEAKIREIAGRLELTSAQVDKVIAETALTEKKTENYDTSLLSPAYRTAEMLGKQADGGAGTRAGTFGDMFAENVIKQGSRAMFGGGGGGGGKTSTTVSDRVIQDALTGPRKESFTSTRTTGGGGGGRNPQDILSLLKGIIPSIPGSTAAPQQAPGMDPQMAPQMAPSGGADPQRDDISKMALDRNINNVPQDPAPQAQPPAMFQAPQAQPPQGAPQGAQQGAPQAPPAGIPQLPGPLGKVADDMNEKTWVRKLPWLPYDNLIPGFSRSKYSIPAVYENSLGAIPRGQSDPKRVIERESTGNFSNLMHLTRRGLIDGSMKDVAGIFPQWGQYLAKFSEEGRAATGIAADYMSVTALADRVRAISGLTVSDKEQERLSRLVPSARNSPAEMAKLALYASGIMSKMQWIKDMNLPPAMETALAGDETVQAQMSAAYDSAVTFMEMAKRAREEGKDSIDLPTGGGKTQKYPIKKIMDLDLYTPRIKKILWEASRRLYPKSPYLPQER